MVLLALVWFSEASSSLFSSMFPTAEWQMFQDIDDDGEWGATKFTGPDNKQ